MAEQKALPLLMTIGEVACCTGVCGGSGQAVCGQQAVGPHIFLSELMHTGKGD